MANPAVRRAGLAAGIGHFPLPRPAALLAGGWGRLNFFATLAMLLAEVRLVGLLGLVIFYGT